MPTVLTIGELSRRTGVKIPTIRYYEKMGLVQSPARSDGNQRRYSDTHLERISFIKHARDLGLPIEAIRELISLSSDPTRPCADADRIASEHLQSIRQRIARLKRLEAELERIASGCGGDQIGQCYVIQALSDHSLCQREH